MAENSKIEWTHHTANLWHGCTKVHEGCDNCYAECLSKRWGNDVWGNDKPRKAINSVWKDFKRYQENAKRWGENHRVFVGSMMDIFEKPMPLIDSKGNSIAETTEHLRNRFFTEVIPNSPNLIFLLLTKRPSNINKYIPDEWIENPPKNVWFGTSPVNQKTADTLIRQLSEVSGFKFISCEPQLDEIDLFKSLNERLRLIDAVHWVIQGGESGHHKRPFNLDWAYSMQKQCRDAFVPYFFKQIDKLKTIPADLQTRELHSKFLNTSDLQIK